MALIDVLKSHVDSSCILLYGPVTDCILSKDLCYREFSVALNDILREAGYDNVVFYDFINASGKYVFDDDSAYHSIANAKVPYENKYGHPPNGGTVKSTAPKLDKPAPKSGRTFGKRPTVVGTAESDSNAETVQPVNQGSQEIPHQQRNLAPAVFYGELQRFMADSSVKTAFVFDINAFLLDSSVRQNVHNILHVWRNPDNIIIFLHPDGGTADGDETLIRRLQETELFQYFCIKDKKGGISYRSDRCFPIYDFEKDEIMSLIYFEKIFSQIQFTESIEDTADKINYLLHQKESLERISLRRFAEKVGKYIESVPSPCVIDSKFYEEVCGVDMKEFDFNPLESLHKRAGWEKATEKLIDILVQFTLARTKQDSPSLNTLEERMNWMMNYKENVRDENSSLIVSRIGGIQKRNYPDSAHLPHIILIGKPGTGKTTAANMMGRILHDAGFLEIGHVYHASAGDLVGEYIGETPSKIRRLLDECENGVLFIDEAYSLCKDFEKPVNAGTYAEEAIDTLVNAMTDENRHVLIIFAGYPSSDPNDKNSTTGVRGLYKMNPGLKRRIAVELEIEDYPPEVLTSIFMNNLAEKKYSLSFDITEENIYNYMKFAYQTRTNEFQNGAFAIGLAEKTIKSAKERNDMSCICRDDFGENKEYLEPVTMDSIEKELNNYPGLHDIGIEIITSAVNLYNNRKKNEIKDPGSPRHIILVGKRGTGKTTLSKVICKAWGMAGIMSGRPPVIIENPASCSHDEIKRKISQAMKSNTVLMIDEAHNCPSAIVQDLLSPMTEYSNLTCIFAVYPERKDELLLKDAGLLGRCKMFEIPDYTPEQLTEIFKAILKRQKREADDSCIEAMSIWFRNDYENRHSDIYYSNARMVENVVIAFEEATPNHLLTEQDIPQQIYNQIEILKRNV